jgi:nicotinate-nucleotide pyrophosphorylase (carboxylating)
MDDRTPLDPREHHDFLRRALAEDRAEEDLTAKAVVPADRRVAADIVAREPAVVAGLPLAAEAFRLLDPDASVDPKVEDGESVGAGTVVLAVEGRARAILSAERTALNLLGRLSGVATLTRAFVEAVLATGARILDTRKTTPGWRALEKYAVRCGGGENHRRDLADAAMIKENHLYAAFGRTGPEAIREAIRRCRESLPADTPLCVEVEDLAEAEAAAQAGAEVLMCDGFELGDLRRVVRMVRGLPGRRPIVEATGGVTLETVEAIAAAGIPRISVGRITKGAPSSDFSLRVRGAR